MAKFDQDIFREKVREILKGYKQEYKKISEPLIDKKLFYAKRFWADNFLPKTFFRIRAFQQIEYRCFSFNTPVIDYGIVSEESCASK